MTQPVQYETLSYNVSTGVMVNISSIPLGFYGKIPAAQQTLTGSKSSNACVSTIVAALAAVGLVVDSTTA